MATVARLTTLADLDDRGGDARHMSVSVRHEVVLVDGRRLLLLGEAAAHDADHEVVLEVGLRSGRRP